MKDDFRLDPAALGHLLARQRAAADALSGCAATLAGTHWAHDRAPGEAAAALDARLGHLAERLSTASTAIDGLADRITAQAAALSAVDAGGD